MRKALFMLFIVICLCGGTAQISVAGGWSGVIEVYKIVYTSNTEILILPAENANNPDACNNSSILYLLDDGGTMTQNMQIATEVAIVEGQTIKMSYYLSGCTSSGYPKITQGSLIKS